MTFNLRQRDTSTRCTGQRPQRGEWVTLSAEPFRGKRAPLPRVNGGLLASTKEAWDAWWASPMAHRWHRVQWGQLQRLAAFTDQVMRLALRGERNVTLAREVRALEKELGISEEGRRHLRWRIAEEEAEAQLASVTPLLSRDRPDPRKKAK